MRCADLVHMGGRPVWVLTLWADGDADDLGIVSDDAGIVSIGTDGEGFMASRDMSD